MVKNNKITKINVILSCEKIKYVKYISIILFGLFSHEKYRIAPDVSQNYASFYISPRLKFETYFPTNIGFLTVSVNLI